MSETELDAAVRQLAALLGVRCYSVRNSRAGVVTSRGYPDLTLAGPGGVAFRELKNHVGVPTPEQLEWGRVLTEAGADWKIWRPDDLQDGVIETELRQIAGQTVKGKR